VPDLFVVSSDGTVKAGLTCTACELSKECRLKSNCMPASGPKNPDFLIVGHQPGVEDDKIGGHFTGKNGRLLKDLLQQAGIDPDACVFTNLLKCSLFGKKPKLKHWNACQKHFKHELEQYNPKAIITLGAQALSWLTGRSGVRQFRRCGIPCNFRPEIYCYPLQQPMAIEHAESSEEADTLRAEMVSDLLWLKEKADNNTLDRPDDIEIDYKLAETVADVKDFIAELDGTDPVIYDLETGDDDLNPQFRPGPGRRIVMVALSKGVGHARAIPYKARGRTTFNWWRDEELAEIKSILTKFFSSNKFVGHNAAKFDSKWILWEFGILPKTDYDTELHHYLIDENLNHGLEDATVEYTNMTPWKPPKLNDLMKDTVELARYACRDVDATSRIKAAMPYNERQKWVMETLLIPLSREFLEMENNGIAVSRENLTTYGKYLDELILEHQSALSALKVVKQYELAENAEFNPDAPNQVAKIMEDYLKLPKIKATKESGGYSTDSSVLEHYLDDEFVSHIYYLKKLTKLKSTYYEVIKTCLEDGDTVHTSVRVDATVTGRASSKNPNLFTPPRPDTVKKTGIKDPNIAKAIFVPHPGHHVLVQVDMSQVELRVLAILSKDKNLMQAYQDGLDLHTVTAQKVFQKEEVNKGQRTGAKRVNFGLVYGMGESSLCARFVAAMREYYAEMHAKAVAAGQDPKQWEFTSQVEDESQRTALKFLQYHKELYPGVWAWMALQERIISTQGYQETLFGRRRHYYKAGARERRQALNYPVQGTAADLCYFALLWSNQEIRELGLDAKFVLTVYDSLIYSCHKSVAWQVAEIVKRNMEVALPAMFDFLTVPIVADVEIGKDLGNMKSADVERKLVKLT